MRGILLMELKDSHCRWPLAGPSGAAQRFCGCRSELGKPYCAEHAALAAGSGTEGERRAVSIGELA